MATEAANGSSADRQHAPVEAQLTEAELRDLTNALPHLVWTCVPDGPCDYLSRQWIDYTGVAEAQQLGFAWLAQLHPDDRERVKAQWAATVGGGVPFDIEFRIRRADGAYRWFRTCAIPLRDAAGKIVKWYGSNTDIDDYKRAEISQRVSEERLRLAQHAAHVGDFEWDLRTGENAWTSELEAMHGLAPGAFGGKQTIWEALVHPEDRATALAHVDRALQTLEPVECEWRVVWPDGSVHWLMGRFQAFGDDSGKPQRLIGVNIDITERKAAEEEIRRLNANLERLVDERTAQLSAANRELEAFSYSVAHDLRAPLRGMSGFAGMLLDDCREKLDPEAIEWIHQIQKNASRMAELIDALLSLARVTRSELRPRTTDLSTLVREVTRQLQSLDPERAVELVITDGLRAHLDPSLARTLIQNLVTNAWKFTRETPSPRIEFGEIHDEDRRVFFVRDNGAGFNMAYADKLFAPFQRLHGTREFPGTGIGLATCHRIVDRHGGRIWAEGRLCQGASFFFSIPRPLTEKAS